MQHTLSTSWADFKSFPFGGTSILPADVAAASQVSTAAAAATPVGSHREPTARPFFPAATVDSNPRQWIVNHLYGRYTDATAKLSAVEEMLQQARVQSSAGEEQEQFEAIEELARQAAQNLRALLSQLHVKDRAR